MTELERWECWESGAEGVEDGGGEGGVLQGGAGGREGGEAGSGLEEESPEKGSVALPAVLGEGEVALAKLAGEFFWVGKKV